MTTGTKDLKVCRGVTCAFRGVEVRTDLESCIGCGHDLDSTASIGALFDDLFGGFGRRR